MIDRYLTVINARFKGQSVYNNKLNKSFVLMCLKVYRSIKLLFPPLMRTKVNDEFHDLLTEFQLATFLGIVT